MIRRDYLVKYGQTPWGRSHSGREGERRLGPGSPLNIEGKNV